MSLLQDKIAIITGGGRGIGRAIATEFIREGANVAIFDKVFPDDFEAYAAEMRTTGRTIVARTVDITQSAQAENACDEIAAELGRIDILVNNAGITRDRLLLRMTEDDWDAVLTVNLKGAFTMTRAAAKTMMRQRSGKIVNISSVVGVMGNAGQANYSASKAGLIGLTKSAAKELAGRNITVNAIAPGYVETDMTAALNEEQRKAFLTVIPLKRGCKPEEIADAVVFFASSKSDYITGQVLCVDGGMVM
jgi:3-oxoacyl-[acyl-carrier protein] reductase